jgi:hypothetical protein
VKEGGAYIGLPDDSIQEYRGCCCCRLLLLLLLLLLCPVEAAEGGAYVAHYVGLPATRQGLLLLPSAAATAVPRRPSRGQKVLAFGLQGDATRP